MVYRIEERHELLHAINEFLDESVVLPPGDFHSNNLLSIQEIHDMRKRRRKRQGKADPKVSSAAEPDILPEEELRRAKQLAASGGDGGKNNRTPYNPMVRTGRLFGGVVNDLKTRFPHYLSDITDGLNTQCLAAIIFIYFACLSGAVAFGGLMGEKTEQLIGIPETLIVSCVSGLIFALFAGQPLIVTGVTGPVLLYDEALFSSSKSFGVEFLPWRWWIGIWLLVIALVVAMFEGSTLVKLFTKFTKDIFASLVSLLFIFEAIRKLFLVR